MLLFLAQSFKHQRQTFIPELKLKLKFSRCRTNRIVVLKFCIISPPPAKYFYKEKSILFIHLFPQNIVLLPQSLKIFHFLLTFPWWREKWRIKFFDREMFCQWWQNTVCVWKQFKVAIFTVEEQNKGYSIALNLLLRYSCILTLC